LHRRERVSVVIPTRGRPQWVAGAVKSALSQSSSPLEVIVVIDGPDSETVLALQAIPDDRLRVIALEDNVGGSEARNIGVRSACGEWIAFLDDDDWWMADKLEKQLAHAASSHACYPVVSSLLLARSPDAERILPRRLIQPNQPVSDYLFCRQSFAYGDGMLQTSTLLIRRELLLEIPFLKGLKSHQDWDWLLKVGGRPDVEILMLPEALTVMRVEGQGASVSHSADWRASLEWAMQNRTLMSRRAYSFFITTECIPRARGNGAGFLVLLQLFWECLWGGQPGLRQMALFVFFCMVPEGARKSLRNRTMRRVAAMEHGA
jgi:glycosyltransferase involved in cell wall biosynthesis